MLEEWTVHLWSKLLLNIFDFAILSTNFLYPKLSSFNCTDYMQSNSIVNMWSSRKPGKQICSFYLFWYVFPWFSWRQAETPWNMKRETD